MKVLITGGGAGIGRAVAEAVIAAGGSVVLVGRREAPLREFTQAHPGVSHGLALDICDEDSREGLCRSAFELLEGLDGFVHSAGEVMHEAPGAITDAALRSQLEVNLVAPLRLGEEALKVLSPGGSMVFVSSTLAHRPVLTSAVYSAAKAGLGAVMKTLAIAGAARGIRSNAVLPGLVDTQMLDGRDKAALTALTPLGRLGTPQDVAATVLHLLSASWMTGSEVVLDGGLLLRE